jgi:hypothetical protein
MRVVDPEHLLVAPIYEVCDSCSISCRLSNGYYKIKYSAIHSDKSQKFKKETGVRLYSSKECIGEIYQKSRDYHHQRYVKRVRKRIEAERLADEMKERRRLRLFDLQTHEFVTVPKSVSWNARHPFQGGTVNPR